MDSGDLSPCGWFVFVFECIYVDATGKCFCRGGAFICCCHFLGLINGCTALWDLYAQKEKNVLKCLKVKLPRWHLLNT